MARIGKGTRQAVGSGGRLTDRISLGVLADPLPRELIEQVLVETGRREQRSRLLPAHVMVRFVLAMCLFAGDAYEEVLRKLVDGLAAMGLWAASWRVPSTAAITKARQRLGAAPLRVLFERVAGPVAGQQTRGAWLGSWRLMAIDGWLWDVADTPDNLAAFGRVGSGPKAGVFPKVRLVGLGECGSHAIVAARLAGCRQGEQPLAGELAGEAEAAMLILADRNFYSFELWHRYRASGAQLLWRIAAGVELPVLGVLPDGSWRSLLLNPKIQGRRRARLLAAARAGAPIAPADAVEVRVVEYEITDRAGDGTGELVTLVCSILDWELAGAVELAAAYHQRWEFETSLAELAVSQRGPGQVLRSKSAEMVCQEVWAFLLTHWAIRRLMCHAADQADLDPDRLSFTRALRVVRRQVTRQAAFSPPAAARRAAGDHHRDP